MNSSRLGKASRQTGESNVSVELVVEGTGDYSLHTGLGMLDHLLAQLSRHGLFDLKVQAVADLSADQHHLVEDVALVLGKALNEALGDRRGIRRMGSSTVPLDEALAMVAVDLGGRAYAVVDLPFSGERIGDLPADLVRHFLESFAQEGRLNLHVRLLSGINDHHKAEAVFKALARALDQACQIDPRLGSQVPSTKGVI